MAKYISELTVPVPLFLSPHPHVLEHLNEITVLFGKNGSGKSQILRAIRDAAPSRAHYISPERAGEISHNASLMQEELAGTAEMQRRRANLAPTYREESISGIQALLIRIAEKSARRGAKNEVYVDELEELLAVLIPDFSFRITSGNSPYELKRVSPEVQVKSVSELSSGETEILTVALDVLTTCAGWELQNQEERLLLLDEPDNHLHPDLQQHLARFLVTLLRRYKFQALIATHSTTLLSALGFHGGSVVSVVYLNRGAPVQRAIPFDKTLRELATCLGGHALMGPLFGAPLLLVEGDDDYRIWSQVPRHPGQQIKFAAIPCNGEEIFEYQKTLEEIFSSLRSAGQPPAGYVLLDGDQSLPGCKQEHVKFLRLSCREAENLYLTDELLQRLGTTWDAARQTISQRAPEFGQKRALLEACNSWDRRETDLKAVANEVARILDDKNLHWTVRVGKLLGECKPSGQLADFLGTDIMQVFWPKPDPSPAGAE